MECAEAVKHDRTSRLDVRDCRVNCAGETSGPASGNVGGVRMGLEAGLSGADC